MTLCCQAAYVRRRFRRPYDDCFASPMPGEVAVLDSASLLLTSTLSLTPLLSSALPSTFALPPTLPPPPLTPALTPPDTPPLTPPLLLTSILPLLLLTVLTGAWFRLTVCSCTGLENGADVPLKKCADIESSSYVSIGNAGVCATIVERLGDFT